MIGCEGAGLGWASSHMTQPLVHIFPPAEHRLQSSSLFFGSAPQRMKGGEMLAVTLLLLLAVGSGVLAEPVKFVDCGE